MPKSSLQVENGLAWTNEARVATVDGMESVVRFGVTESGELRIVLPDYYRGWKPDAINGLTDVLLGWKQQLTGGTGSFQVSVAPGLTLPSGSSGRTGGELNPQLAVAWSGEMAAKWSTSGVQYMYYSAENSRHFLQGETVIAMERRLTRTVEAYIEFQSSYGHFGASYMAAVGVFYRKRPHYQWDFSVGTGVDRGAVELSVGTGISFRIANFWRHPGDARSDP
ncbi:MAG: transporter [Acidobacteriia bacterium]|nr:transporter [Terriglobia bacterium]